MERTFLMILQHELENRLRHNPQYSLRAFAKSLGLSHSLISMIFSGKRKISPETTRKVALHLGLQSAQQSMFSVPSDEGHKEIINPAPSSKSGNNPQLDMPPEGEDPSSSYYQISLDTFTVLSDWHYYAILSLLELPDATLEDSVVAKKLRISRIKAKMAISRLKRLQLVEFQDGRWKQSVRPMVVDNKISTKTTRTFHKQLLHKALESLEKDPADVRDFSSMTFAMDPSLVGYARKRIQEFRRSLMEDLESKGNAKAVYNLTVQIYPVSEVSKARNE